MRKNTFHQFTETYKQTLVKPDPVWPDDIRRAIMCLHQHLFSETLSVGFLKEQCGVNGKSFSARFKRYVGRHPGEYIIHHRIAAGKMLLKGTNARVTHIALELGFSSLSSFDKTFYNRVEMTPSGWRKAANNGKLNKE